MTIALTAPITVDQYKANFPLLRVPTDMADDPVTQALNSAWKHITDKCMQPLDSTANTDVYQFPGYYVNTTPSGDVWINLKNNPLISVTSIKWSTNITKNGWSSCSDYDSFIEKQSSKVVARDVPFDRGSYGFLQVIYTSGYAVIPDNLLEACALLAAHYLSGGLFPTQGSTGEGSVLPMWIPKDVTDIINLYKRVF